MELTKGIFTDTHPTKNPEGTWLDGRNMVLSKKYQGVANEYGFLKLSTTYHGAQNIHNKLPIGVIPVKGTSTFLVFTCILDIDTGEVTASEIGTIDADNSFDYVAVISSAEDVNNDLAFSPEHQISGEAVLNINGDIVCAFTDFYNTPKVINCSDDFTNFDIKQILMFPESNEGDLSISIVDGGSLPSGTIYITSKYVYKDNSYTNYGTISEPSFITQYSAANGYNDFIGTETNIQTNKALKLNFTDLDVVYSHIVIGVIFIDNGIVKCYDTNKIPVNSPSLEYVLSDINSLNETTILDLTSKTTAYEAVKCITTINKQLYLANTRNKEEFKFQKYANLIELEVKSTLLDSLTVADSAKEKEYNSDKASLMHDEVYAIYIAPVFTDNTLGYLYHIPGREVQQIKESTGNLDHTANENTEIKLLIPPLNVSGDYDDLFLNTATGSDDSAVGTDPKYYQTRCTAIPTTGTQCKTGFWENENEFYPVNDEYNSTVDYDGTTPLAGLDLTNGGAGDVNVRHHRMPDISWLKTNFYNGDAAYGISKFDTLSLIVKNLFMPQSYLNKVQGFKFFFAKKNPDNSLILCNDIAHYMATESGVNLDSLLNTGGNFLVTDKAVTKLDVRTSSIVERMKCHAADLLINQPAINPSYIKQHLRLYTYGNTITYYDGNSVYGVADYTDSSGLAGHINNSNALLDNIYRVRKISNTQYVPNDTVVYIDGKKVENTKSEEFYHFVVNTATRETHSHVIFTNMTTVTENNLDFNSSPKDMLELIGTILYSLCNYKTDVHIGFDNQNEFVSFAKYLGYNYLNDAGNYTLADGYLTYDDFDLNGGDTVISDNSYLAYGMRFLNDYTDGAEGIKLVHRFIAPARTNLALRSLGSTIYSNFYPKILDKGWINNANRVNNPIYDYNSDYSKRGTYEVCECFNIANIYVTQNPYRIVKGTPKTNTQAFETWREFLNNDFYEFVTNFGAIENIQGLSNGELLIQNQALYKTRSIARIGTDGTEATLGTGDLFEFPPQEFEPDDTGYIGTKHKHACKLTPYGYVSVDANRGKVYIVGSEKKELAMKGLHNFFRDYGKTNISNSLGYIDDCPIVYNGYNIEFDEFFNRLIIGKRDYTLKPEFEVGYFTNIDDVPVLVTEDDGNLLPNYPLDENLKFAMFKEPNNYTYTINTYEWIPYDPIPAEPPYGYWVVTEIPILPTAIAFFDNNSFTLSYSFDYDCWAFFHDYYPNYLFRLRNNRLFSVGIPQYATPIFPVKYTGNNIFSHNNILTKGIYYNYDLPDGVQLGTPYTSYIIPVINDINSFFLHNILWISYVQENDKNIMKNETFNRILLYNTNQCSGNIELTVYQSIADLYDTNVRKTKENWIFSQFKDLVDNHSLEFIEGGNGVEITPINSNINSGKEFQDKNRFYDKWLAIKLIYDNAIIAESNDQNNILLTFLDVIKSQLRR